MSFKDAINSVKGALSTLLEDKESPNQKKTVEIKTKPIALKETKKINVKPKIKVIRRTEDIPNYESVISGKDGKIVISEDKQGLYSVLRVAKDNDNVIIVCSEQTMDLPVDNNFLNILKQCRELGFKAKKIYATKDVIEIISEKDEETSAFVSEDEKGPVHDRLREIVRAAKSFSTSDIHIEVRKGEANIFMRIDGDKTHYKQIKEDLARTIARVAYSSLGKDKDVTFNERKPQDAKVDMSLDGENVSIRLSTIPASPKGFDMVLRILPSEAKEQEYKSLIDLGYSEEHVKLLDIANAIPVGVIVMSGVTGSGKTTSLTTMINNKMVENENKLKAITIEDPPEILMRNVTSVPVVRRRGEDASESFAENMRATLRCDPDILMPGEIRDKTTGSLLVSAVQSGHQVFTTVHAPSAIGSIDRLREIGVKSNILGSHDFISALVNQSLIPINCDACSISMSDFLNSNNALSEQKRLELIERVEIASKTQDHYNISAVRFKSEKGCKACGGRGITKREVIAEVIIPDSKMKKFFKEEDDASAIQYYREVGGKLMIDHGLDKLFAGRVDPRNLERKVGRIDMSEYSMSSMLTKIRLDIEKNKAQALVGETLPSKSALELKSSLNANTERSSSAQNVVDLRPMK